MLALWERLIGLSKWARFFFHSRLGGAVVVTSSIVASRASRSNIAFVVAGSGVIMACRLSIRFWSNSSF
jgi:hypothetical protein